MSRFRVMLPGFSLENRRVESEAVDSLYPNPKINTKAQPPHAGIIFLNWVSTTPIAHNTTKLIYSFAHGYAQTPTVFGSYKFDNGSTKQNGVMAFQYGSLGMVILDTDPVNVNLKYYSLDASDTAPITAFTMYIRFYVMAETGYEV